MCVVVCVYVCVCVRAVVIDVLERVKLWLFTLY